MKVTIKRIDKSLPLPQYQTPGSVAVDLLARLETVVYPKSVALIPANIIVATPPRYSFIVVSRSSGPRKLGLSTPHGIGVIDQDYSGEDDEVQIQVYNFTSGEVVVKKGDRIAQGMFVRVDQVVWKEADKMDDVSRGGFGTTG